jgi:hypothetical protein
VVPILPDFWGFASSLFGPVNPVKITGYKQRETAGCQKLAGLQKVLQNLTAPKQ